MFSPLCRLCGEDDGTRALEIGWKSSTAIDTKIINMCAPCRRRLLLCLLDDLPAFPCGYDESEIRTSPTLGGTFLMTQGYGPLTAEEALGIAADIIRTATTLKDA